MAPLLNFLAEECSSYDMMKNLCRDRYRFRTRSPCRVLRSEYIIRHAALTLGSPPFWLAEELFFVPTQDENKQSAEHTR